MKKILFLIIVFVTIFLSSCFIVEENIETVPISESLKISTWVLKEEHVGNGYFTYDGYRRDKGHYVTGHWINDDGTEIYNVEEIFESKTLEPNTPYILAPLGFDGYNLNIYIVSDDVITVSAEIRNNHDIILAHSPSSPDEVIPKDWSVSNNITVVGSFTLNVLPVGKIIAADTREGKLAQATTLTDREYYIDINTYTLDGRPRVTAQLKLTVIKDEDYPWREPQLGSIYGGGEEQSRFLEIELVKFGYSDTALHDEFERYDHLYN